MSQQPALGSEAKLALLYRQLVVLLQRQAKFSADQGWVVASLLQLTDVLTTIADSSPGWSHNLLGAIGLGSSQAGFLIEFLNFFNFLHFFNFGSRIFTFLKCTVAIFRFSLIKW